MAAEPAPGSRLGGATQDAIGLRPRSAIGWRCLGIASASARALGCAAWRRPRSVPVSVRPRGLEGSGARGVPRGPGGPRSRHGGSRTQRIGSVFSRTRDLLRIGIIKKPLWFDVYAAFPPLREPVHRAVRPRYGRSVDPVAPVFYREDEVRARFYRVYGSGPRPFDLTQLNFKSTCQRFVEKYNELKEEGKIEEEKLFEETGKALLASGIILQRRATDKVAQQEHQGSAGTRDPALHQQLQTVLEELQEKRKGGEEQTPELAGTQKENPPPS
ncbi:28S ribosomal protein S23, mitochondrial [Manacus vitellinus]|uniref:28S ribosomal protein S23, mitochondrial n=1 Tax=Manacus vitellinus TaxID=328815 RepID=UPI00115DE6BB|nr:28S ribosomal protein S23, mitochondrial [Manacus vitellinus]